LNTKKSCRQYINRGVTTITITYNVVYSKVKHQSICIDHIIYTLAKDLLVRYQHLNVDGWVLFRSTPCGFRGGQRAIRAGFLPVLQFSPTSHCFTFTVSELHIRPIQWAYNTALVLNAAPPLAWHLAKLTLFSYFLWNFIAWIQLQLLTFPISCIMIHGYEIYSILFSFPEGLM
jgi:hypothetical protein